MFSKLYKKLEKEWFGLSKKRQVFYFTFLFIVLLIVAIPSPVKASLLSAVSSFLGSLLALFITWLSKIITLEILVFQKVAQFNTFLGATAVKEGWRLVRDVCNMFFIIILMIISFATILKVESYSYKKWLGKLVIAAILINFSKTITGLLIGFSQVVMLTFVSAFSDAVAGNLGAGLHLNEMMSASKKSEKWTSTQEGDTLDAGAIFGALLLALILLTVFVVVMLIMIVVLVGRIVSLWVLIILSPVAFLLQSSPFGAQYAKQWWQQLGKNLVSGPVLAFFLWLAFFTIQRSSGQVAKEFNADQSDELEESDKLEEGVFLTGISSTTYLMDYIVTSALLMTAIKLTGDMGVIGSSFAGKMQQNLGKWGKATAKGVAAPLRLGAWGAKQGVGYLGRKYNEKIYEGKLPGWANPFATVRAWKSRSTHLRERAKKGADAGAEESLEKVFTGVATPRRLQLQMADAAQFSKDYEGLAKEQVGQIAFQLMQKGESSENLARRRAIVKYAFQRGFDDDIIADPSTIEQLSKDPDFKDIINIKDIATGEDGKMIISKEMYSKFYGKFIGQHQAGIQLISEGDEISHKTKHSILAGNGTYDPQVAKYRMTNITGERVKVGQDYRTGKDVYAEAYEGQHLEQLEYNKEPGRDKLKGHIHGMAKVAIYERPIKDSNGDVIIDEKTGKPKTRKVLGVGDIDDFIKERQKAAYAGQADKGLREHTVERTNNLLMGGEAADMPHTNKGLEINGNALKVIALLNSVNDDAVKTFWEKTGGQTEIPTFIVADKTFTLPEITAKSDKIIRADTKEKWDELLDRKPESGGDGGDGGEPSSSGKSGQASGKSGQASGRGRPTSGGDARPTSEREESREESTPEKIAHSAKSEMGDSQAGLGHALIEAIEKNFSTTNIEQALNSIETVLSNLETSLQGGGSKQEVDSLKALKGVFGEFQNKYNNDNNSVKGSSEEFVDRMDKHFEKLVKVIKKSNKKSRKDKNINVVDEIDMSDEN